MDELRARALALLRKANDDLAAALCLGAAESTSLWTIGFHVQQAVEKSLKAVLLQQGVHYPFTHDIAALVKLVQQAGLALPPDHDDLPYVTPFGTLFRYEDDTEDLSGTIERAELVGIAKKTVEWAQRHLERDKPAPQA